MPIPKPDSLIDNVRKWSSYETARKAYLDLGWSDDLSGFEFETLEYHPVRGARLKTWKIALTACKCGASKGLFVMKQGSTVVKTCGECRRTNSIGQEEAILIDEKRIPVKEAWEWVRRNKEKAPFGMPLEDTTKESSVFR